MLEIADAEVMQAAVRQDIHRSEESRYNHRLHEVLQVASGRFCIALNQVFREDVRMVQFWGMTVRAPRVLPGFATASTQHGLSCWTPGSGRVWRVTFVVIHVAVVMPSFSGTVRCEPTPEAAHRS